MKAFSPAGAAVKAFYGFGAKTFGNPQGHTSGNGAVVNPGLNWHPPLHTPDPTAGAGINGITTSGAVLFITDPNGNAYQSSDGGNTWFPTFTEPGAVGNGNPVFGAGATLIAPGSGDNAQYSTNTGTSWTPVTGIAGGGSTFLIGTDGAGNWVGFANFVGPNNCAVSHSLGHAWATLAHSGLPGDIAINGPPGWDGVHFGVAGDALGGLATSLNGNVWAEIGGVAAGYTPTSINFCGGFAIAGVQKIGSQGILYASSFAGLSAGTFVQIPINDNITFSACSSGGLFAFLSDQSGVALAGSPGGPFQIQALPYLGGGDSTGLIFDAVHGNFVLTANDGTILIAAAP